MAFWSLVSSSIWAISGLVSPTMTAAAPPAVSIYVPDWTLGLLTNSTPTYQTSINPKYRMDPYNGTSNISKTVFANMAALNADYMRHVPWFPYPHLAVAQLTEPKTEDKKCNSGWDFTYIDPITEALNKAVGDHPLVLNFATIPEWMWESPDNHTYPDDPNQQDGGYDAGNTLRDPTFKEVTGYFHKLATYYTHPLGFVDECNVRQQTHIQVGGKEGIAWWEVLNEPDYEHSFSPEYYIKIYDSVATDLKKLLPNTKFLSVAMGDHNRTDFFSVFLNRSNHMPSNVPIDGLSYHQYIFIEGEPPVAAPKAFADMDLFVDEIVRIEAFKHKMEQASLKNRVETFINEIGCGTHDESLVYKPHFYTLCAATYAYLFAKAAPLQVEHLGVSQVIGFSAKSLCDSCPSEWPSTSMVNWFTGHGNARYWVLKMMIDEFPTGTKRTPNTFISSSFLVYAQAFVTLKGGDKKVLIISKSSTPLDVSVDGSTGGTVSYVDDTTGDQFGCAPRAELPCYVRRRPLDSDTFTLGPYGTAVVVMP